MPAKAKIKLGKGVSGTEIQIESEDKFLSRQMSLQLCEAIRTSGLNKGFVTWIYYMAPNHLVRLAWPLGGHPEPKNIEALRKKILKTGIEAISK